jgi:hypothetical protein
MASKNLDGYRPERIELVADSDDLPSPEAEVIDRHFLPVVLVGPRPILEPERDGNRIGEAALTRQAGCKREKRSGVATSRKTHEAGRDLQARS